MFKKLLLSVAVLAPLAAASPALALDTAKTYSVSYDGAHAGTWRLRALVSESLNTCNYTVKWSDLSGPPLSRTALCKITEDKAGDDFDCEVARRGFFDTIVQKGSGTCHGFDDFGQQTTITQLIAGESSGGTLTGVVMSASVGDVQNLLVK